MKLRTVNFMDAARMTAQTSRETTHRVSRYFGEAGPFSYGKVRALTPTLLAGQLAYRLVVGSIEKIKFDVARKSNLDVAKLLSECHEFNGKTFYKLKRALYAIDRDFALALRPEAVAVVDGIPNLIFLQPRKNPVPWIMNHAFLRRVVDEVYHDYFDEFKVWLIDTEANQEGLRKLKLIDLQTSADMSEREFVRRVASLRQAWRIHLAAPQARKQRDDRHDDRQGDFFADD